MRQLRVLLPALVFLAVSLIAISCGQKVVSEPPVARIEHVVDTLFGQEIVDDYGWLRDDSRSDPEVLRYLEAENAYTTSAMRHTEDLQETLFSEMRSRIKDVDLSVPVRDGDFFYYTRTEEGKQYDLHCRKKGSLEATEETLLDVNLLAEGKQFMDVGVFEVSDDHSILAYATDETGNERYTLRFKNLKTGELYPDSIDNIASSVAWAADNKTIFYVTPDDAWRPFKLWRHRLGDPAEQDQMVYHETDDQFWLDIHKSRDDRFIFAGLGSQTSSECRFLDASNPTGDWKTIHPRTPDLEYEVYHHGQQFYILTNDNAINFKLVSVSDRNPAQQNWTEVIGHRDNVKIDRVAVFADHMALYEREDGLQHITIRAFSGEGSHRVEFPEPVYSLETEDNPDFESKLFRFAYESLTTPESVYDYNMANRDRELKKQEEVPGSFKSEDYQSERVFATATDGTQIPISLVYRKGTALDGSSPLYLYGYGSYGISYDPYFSSNRLSLLDRGFVFAIAHIRGGGVLGRPWYYDGKLLNKKNSFTDFIACGEHLISEKYTSSDKLVIAGGSAGGLLVGAVINMAPDLAEVAVADVPFVDVINTMLDESIPLTVIEYDEWGNPNEKEFFEYMMSYSPYDNAMAKGYPHLLITAGLNDTRVQYWEPAKWAAKLRALKTDNNRLFLKTNMGAGHGGSSGRYDYLREIALEYAFILDQLGL